MGECMQPHEEGSNSHRRWRAMELVKRAARWGPPNLAQTCIVAALAFAFGPSALALLEAACFALVHYWAAALCALAALVLLFLGWIATSSLMDALGRPGFGMP